MALDRTWYNTLVDDDGSGLTGSIWDKADVNALMTAVDNELAPDTCHVTAITRTTGLASGAWVAVEYDTVLWQTKTGMFVAPGNYITIKTTGYYLVTGAVTFGIGNWETVRGLCIYLNGAAAPGRGGQQILSTDNSLTYTVLQTSAIVKMNANDLVQLAAYQNTGAGIFIGGLNPAATNHMQVTLIRK